jgi:hypothetical protein
MEQKDKDLIQQAVNSVQQQKEALKIMVGSQLDTINAGYINVISQLISAIDKQDVTIKNLETRNKKLEDERKASKSEKDD